MDKMTIKTGLAAATLLVAAAAAHADAGTQLTKIARGDAVVAFEMYWPERDAQAVAERVGALAGLMTGEKVHTDDLLDKLGRADAKVSAQALGGAPNLAFAYLPEFDEIRLANQELIAGADPDADIGEAAAIDVARKTLADMAEAGVIDARDFDTSQAQVGYRKVAGGTVDGVTDYEHVVEYRVTFRRNLNGIELANSGVRIGVHSGGDVSSLRVGGVDVARDKRGDLSLPLARGEIRDRTVAADAIRARFEAEQPKNAEARVAYSKLMYVMPEDTRRAVVAPTEVFAYALAFPTESGVKAVSRRQVVGYDVTDAKAAARLYTAPAARVADDEGVRTQ